MMRSEKSLLVFLTLTVIQSLAKLNTGAFLPEIMPLFKAKQDKTEV